MAFKSRQQLMNYYFECEKEKRFLHPFFAGVLVFICLLWANSAWNSSLVWIPLLILYYAITNFARKEGHFSGYLEGYDEAMCDAPDTESLDLIDDVL